MERNDFTSPESTQGQSASSSGGSLGNTGDLSGSQGYGANTGSNTSASSTGASSASSDQGLTDRARNIAGSAQDRLADVGSNVRERAGHVKDSLADALESGADKLRQRGQSGQLAGSTGSSAVAIEGDGRMSQVSGRVAGGMQATADWLRDADLDNLRSGLERQVKEHPGRTLLIAVGVGYLLGKALRK